MHQQFAIYFFRDAQKQKQVQSQSGMPQGFMQT
jgi:hypothetical protein